MATSIFVENYREKYEKILKEELLETLVDVTPPQAKKLIDIEDEFRRYHPASGGKIDHLANPADFDK